MTKRLRLPIRETPPSERLPEGAPAEVVGVEYEPHELAFMERRRNALDGPDKQVAREAANEMAVLHELKALFGARMLSEDEEIALGFREPPEPAEVVQTTFLAPEGTESFFKVPPKARQALGVSEPDVAAASAARDEAMRRVDAAAPPDWKVAALMEIRKVARRQAKLTTDDVWRSLGWAPPEPRAIGPLMTKAENLGYIMKSEGELRKGDRVVNHARPQQVWLSLIYQEAHTG